MRFLFYAITSKITQYPGVNFTELLTTNSSLKHVKKKLFEDYGFRL